MRDSLFWASPPSEKKSLPARDDAPGQARESIDRDLSGWSKTSQS
jgi:hypothetical protein